MQVAPADSVQTVPADTLPAVLEEPSGFFGDAQADSVNGGLYEELAHAGDRLLAGDWAGAADLFVEDILGLLAGMLPRVLIAFAVFLALYTLYRAIFMLVRRVLRRHTVVRQGLATLAEQAYRLVAVLGISIIVLQTLGIDPASMLAGIGIVGIALGFAARDTVENVISGASILTDQPFRIGDTVIYEGTYGIIREITLRTTRLVTTKNEVLVVPNSLMANQMVLNHTIGGVLRIEIPFSIAYKERPQEAREVVLKLTRGDERLCANPEPSVVVTALNDSSIDLMLWVYVPDPTYERQITYHYNEHIREALRAADIEIPFPHMQIIKDAN